MGWPQAGTTRCGCGACEGQRPARPRASAPGPVSAPPADCCPLWLPATFHGWGTPTPSGSPIRPGHRPPFPRTCGAVPEALVCPAAALAPPRHLSFSDVSHDSARVSWEGTARPVRLFRVSYVSSKGGHSGQVRPAPARGRCPGLSSGVSCPWGPSALRLPHWAPCIQGRWVWPGLPRHSLSRYRGSGGHLTPPGPLWAPGGGRRGTKNRTREPSCVWAGGAWRHERRKHRLAGRAGGQDPTPVPWILRPVPVSPVWGWSRGRPGSPSGGRCPLCSCPCPHPHLPADGGSWERHLGHSGPPLVLHRLHGPRHLPLPWGQLLHTHWPPDHT